MVKVEPSALSWEDPDSRGGRARQPCDGRRWRRASRKEQTAHYCHII